MIGCLVNKSNESDAQRILDLVRYHGGSGYGLECMGDGEMNRDYPEVDWSGPLTTVMRGVPVKIWEWEEDCKWLEVGAGRYMYNNDGTCVSGGGMRVFNPIDWRAMRFIEGWRFNRQT